MKMTDENRMNPASFHSRAHQLELGSLTAIEQENVAFPNQRRRGQSASQSGHSRTGSEKHDFHGYLNIALKT